MKNVLPLDQNIKDKFSFLPGQIESMSVATPYNTLLIDSGLKSDMFNILCSTGNESTDDIAKSISHFREKNLPFCFWVGFESDPEWLEKELRSHGLNNEEAELVMVADLAQVNWTPPPKGFEIERAGVEEFLEVLLSLFSGSEREAIDKFYHLAEPILSSSSVFELLVGYFEGKPVATSSVFFSHGIASIFDVIVLDKMRGKGLGKAITLGAMHLAKMAGYTQTALTATNDAKYLYEKIGYTSLKEMCVYA